MPTANSVDDSVDDAITKLLTEVGDDPKKMAKRYLDLQTLNTKQSEEVGANRQTVANLEKANTTLTENLGRSKQYVDWYNQNQQGLSQYAQWAQQAQAQAANPQVAPAATAESSDLDLLTSTERQSIVTNVAAQVQQQNVAYQQQFAQQMQQAANEAETRINTQLGKQQNAFSEVQLQTLSHILSEDQMENAKEFQKVALGYADTSNMDPLAMAKDSIKNKMDMKAKDTQIEELQAKIEARDKEDHGYFNSNSSADLFETQDNAPATKADRYKAVMKDVNESVGADTVRAQFPEG